MTARAEQETTIAIGRDDAIIRIWTNDLPKVRRLRKLASEREFVTEVKGEEEWGQFEIRAENFYLFSALRAKRTMSDEQRATQGARLAGARAAAVSP